MTRLEDFMDATDSGALARWKLNLTRYANEVRQNYPTAASVLSMVCGEMESARRELRKSKIKLPKPVYWYVRGTGWFVIRTIYKTRARQLANEEYGRNNVSEIRPATNDEISEYMRLKGIKDISEIDNLDDVG